MLTVLTFTWECFVWQLSNYLFKCPVSQKIVYYYLLITLQKCEYCLISDLNGSILFGTNCLKVSVLCSMNCGKSFHYSLVWKELSENIRIAQETHLTEEINQKWKEGIGWAIFFFSHGKFNSCGVLIALFSSKSVIITKEISDSSGPILVLKVKIDNEIYLLVNLYNPNTKPEQLKKLNEPETILLKFDANKYNHIIFSCDFNMFLSASLEETGGNAKLKNTFGW